MANKELKARVKNKRDTAANWESKNPVILNGEVILVDTNAGELRAKIGDGTKTYKQLPFYDEVLRNLITDKSNLALSSAKEYTDSEISEWVGDSTVATQISEATANYLPLSGGVINGNVDTNDAYMYNLGSDTHPFGMVYAGTFKGNLEGSATSATTAGKLSTDNGSATQPVYFSDGKPVACTYTLEKSVPSDAKFTDTTYTLSSFGITATASELNKLDGCTATVTELNYVDGVTSNIQTQLNGKAASTSPKISTSIELHGATPYIDFHFNNDQGDYTSRIIESASGTLNVDANLQVNGTNVSLDGHTHGLNTSTITGILPVSKGGTNATTAAAARTNLGAQATIRGAATTVTDSDLTKNRALISSDGGKIAVSAVTSTELGYLDGVTSPIQMQLTNLGSRITNSTNALQDSLDSHTHASLTHSDGVGKVAITKDGDYYYFRAPNSNTYCGSGTYPWYKICTKRLEVTSAKPQFTFIGSDGGGSTVSSGANVFVGATGLLSRSSTSSSRTIKHDIKKLEDEQIKAERLYDVNIYQAKYNADILDEADNRYLKDLPMFIIEDLDEKYPIVIDKPSDNVKEWSWNSQYIIPPMLKLIQDQKKEIDVLKERLDILESK